MVSFLSILGTLRIAASALKPEIFTFDYINGIPFANLFTVNTNQTFDRLRVQDLIVQKPLTVHELVNNIKIENERANTVMVCEMKIEIKNLLNFIFL